MTTSYDAKTLILNLDPKGFNKNAAIDKYYSEYKNLFAEEKYYWFQIYQNIWILIDKEKLQ